MRPSLGLDKNLRKISIFDDHCSYSRRSTPTRWRWWTPRPAPVDLINLINRSTLVIRELPRTPRPFCNEETGLCASLCRGKYLDNKGKDYTGYPDSAHHPFTEERNLPSSSNLRIIERILLLSLLILNHNLSVRQ